MASMELYEERIHALKSDLHSYGKEIIEHIQILYNVNSNATIVGQNIQSIDLKNDPMNVLKILRHDVEEVLRQSHETEAYKSELKKDLQECNELSLLLENISTISSQLIECEQYLNVLSVSGACELVCLTEKSLQSLQSKNKSTSDFINNEFCSGKVYTTLYKEHKLLKSRLISKIRRLLNDSITFEYGRIAVAKQLTGMLKSEDKIIDQPIQLFELWDSLSKLNKCDDIIEWILKETWRCIFHPLWKEKKPFPPNIIENQEHDVSYLLFETISRDQSKSSFSNVIKESEKVEIKSYELGSCRTPLPQLLEYVGVTFSFIHSHVIRGNAKVADVIAKKLNAQNISFMSLIVSTLSCSLPKTENDLVVFRRSVETPCKEFENVMKKLSFFDQTDDDNNQSQVPSMNPLSDFLENLKSRFAELRRKEILERARELVLSDYHNSMIAAGDALEDELSSAGDIGDPTALLDQSGTFALQKLKFESCQVSLASCRLLKLVHEVMKQACSASPSLAMILFQSARDCIEIFMAVVPVKFSDVIDTVPRMGAMFYNDCLYIAHNSTLITHRYRQGLGKVDEVFLHITGFSDFIPRLRCITSHLDEQKRILYDLVRRIRFNCEGNELNDENKIELRPGGLLKLAGRLGKIGFGSSNNTYNNSINDSNDSDSLLDSKDNLSKNIMKLDDNNVCNDLESAGLVVKHLERLSGQWKGVLQESVYL
eukprot:gene9864-13271_t